MDLSSSLSNSGGERKWVFWGVRIFVCLFSGAFFCAIFPFNLFTERLSSRYAQIEQRLYALNKMYALSINPQGRTMERETLLPVNLQHSMKQSITKVKI